MEAHRQTGSRGQDGMTIMEVVIVIVLMSILFVAGLSTITLLDRSSRRQALHTTAMELAQGRIEELLSKPYDPHASPFADTPTTIKTNIVLVLNNASTNTLVGGTMTTVTSPVARGHLVTVTVATTNANQPLTVALQTVINQKSGNQP